MSDAANKTGTAYALTIFAAILPGHLEQVRSVIEGLGRGPKSPLARLPQLHFSRLQIIEHPVWQGAGDVVKFNQPYLVWTNSLNGELEPYLDTIADRIPREVDSWFSHCVGYPGTSDRAGFKRWMRNSQIECNLFVSAYPTATVADVRQSLETRNRVVDFAISAQGLDAGELQKRFIREFGDVR